MGAAQLWELFQATYLRAPAAPAVVCHTHRLDEDGQGIELDVTVQGVSIDFGAPLANWPTADAQADTAALNAFLEREIAGGN